ncbi:MAG: hypothetical protein NE328_11025, partial [Lentisphaeraceae bacterium]|nr:hypothetical protein [Lentisphaeraceae bacterium]
KNKGLNMTRKFQIEGIGNVDVSEELEMYSLKIRLSDMRISREIKFYSQGLLSEFFKDITEDQAKDMALATIRNKINLSLKNINN